MRVGVRNSRVSRVSVVEPVVRANQQPVQTVRLSQLGRMRACEQVAAVCYRFHRGTIEFLLVQTRGSKRWTFPKGSAEPGLTHAQAAAIEAFEEAGVHGRIEEAAFIRYACGKGKEMRNVTRSAAKIVFVSAHLCEVRRLCSPKESDRNRTWFSVEDAKQRLREGRKKVDGREFVRVVERAVARIGQLEVTKHTLDQPVREVDDLQRVQFETKIPWRHEALLYAGGEVLDRGQADVGEVLPFGPLRLLSGARRVRALGPGAKVN